MATKPRVQHPSAIYHFMNRGDRREDIFHEDQEREHFLESLEEACGKADWQVHWVVTAERLIREGVKQGGWSRAQLDKLRKGDGEKVKIARRLGQETTVPWAWIAKELTVGIAGNAANLVRAG